VLAQAAINPASDTDIFAVVLGAGSNLKVETFDAGGPGACAGIDTVIQLLAPDGSTVLATDNDGGLALCSKIDSTTSPGAANLAAGTYFIRVTESGQDSTIPGYVLRIGLNP
jgi:hypothetical protein